MDFAIVKWLRKRSFLNKSQNNSASKLSKVYVIANKCESPTRGRALAQAFWELGIDNVFPISALHGEGLNDVLDDVFDNGHMPTVSQTDMHGNGTQAEAVNVAILGRANVGKSSLFNRYGTSLNSSGFSINECSADSWGRAAASLVQWLAPPGTA
jgi:GTPase Era involved in 16S rRNA processing